MKVTSRHVLPGVRVSVIVGRTAGVNTLIASAFVETLLIDRTADLLFSALVDVCVHTTDGTQTEM